MPSPPIAIVNSQRQEFIKSRFVRADVILISIRDVIGTLFELTYCHKATGNTKKITIALSYQLPRIQYSAVVEMFWDSLQNITKL